MLSAMTLCKTLYPIHYMYFESEANSFMRSPSRIKAGISLLALFALAGSFLLFGLLSRGNPTHAAGIKSAGATTGRLTPFAVVDPKSLTLTSEAAAPGSTHPKERAVTSTQATRSPMSRRSVPLPRYRPQGRYSRASTA